MKILLEGLFSMVYMALDSFGSLCGWIDKGKILILDDGSLYYNGKRACRADSVNGRKCRKIESN
jgi:hypothetical protein